ncbi:hypothetical protein GCM10009623_27190 [Nocardioides aestuarii]|uniref:Uncharacterized protein n=1 Tax=Nocardioides aestuarii TaxID=252231 RepID=A0ABW4TPJ0_9ACTN
MSTDETQPVKGTPHDPQSGQPDQSDQPQPPPVPEDAAERAEPATGRGRFAGLRERAGAVRGGMVAAVLAGVIVGGAGGFAVGAPTTDHHGPGDRGPEMMGRPFDHDGDGDDHGFRPDGAPGQLPPTTAPEEESDLSNS